jgi:hypothetical protein
MEEKVLIPQSTISPSAAVCPQCHQAILPTYYFCPNCGKKLNEAPLSTSPMAQTGLYAFSIILPLICYLAIGYWKGIKYMESRDAKAKQIGIIAFVLLLLSSAITFWISISWIQSTISSAMTSVGNIGNF